jgi:hypothetical protein
MKNAMRILVLTIGVIIAAIAIAQAQAKIDEERMQRDIEVAENVLSTLIKQQFTKRNFFPMDVEGTYMEGYGLTFRVPMDYGGQMTFMLGGASAGFGMSTTDVDGTHSNNYVYQSITEDIVGDDDCQNCPAKVKVKTKGGGPAKNYTFRKKEGNDSLQDVYTQNVIAASKDFLADYGDMISQLSPQEKINVTNRMEGARNWIWKTEGGRVYLSIEVSKSDITLFKQGKLTRDQFMERIKLVNSKTTDDLSPDLELLSSIFNRLYQMDLSKTYFIQEDVYYERLKDYGVIYNMHVYSSTEADFKRANLPTLGISNIDQEERDKRVKELYPAFEKGIKTDILEYGKTLRSLGDQELLVFKIKVTQCKGCGIPTTLEVSVKDSVLKDYSSGKLTAEAAADKLVIKKGANQ